MKVTEAVAKRRSVKWFDPQHQMPDDLFQRLMQHALLSPTAFNIQNWRFVRVTDTAQRRAIRAAAWDQAQVEEASELLVLCFDRKAWERDPERYWRLAPKEVRDFLVPAIARYYGGKPQIERDEGMRSCGLVAQNLMLVAQELGYDSCPMDGFDYARVGEIIALPDDHEIAFMLAIGKGVKEPWPRPGQLALDEVMVENRFGLEKESA
ncbi:MAG: nitroreductase family protein [Gammaproteobacteria bacterium]|nr:nitroreductase family protein [Gammaproteobacteria bacterium]